MRMKGLLRAGTVPGMGNDRQNQIAGHVARILMVASFPLRLLFQAPKAEERDSAAAVHHYGART
jgi:hypothetical protein